MHFVLATGVGYTAQPGVESRIYRKHRKMSRSCTLGAIATTLCGYGFGRVAGGGMVDSRKPNAFQGREVPKSAKQ